MLASLPSLTAISHATKVGRFLGMVMYDNEFKQKKIKFRPRIKLSHNIYINLYVWISVWREVGGRIVVVVTKKIKQ